MKARRWMTGWAMMLAAVGAMAENEATPVASSISEVTVYSDRALVTRKATVRLKPGLTVYAFNKLPGWVDEGSIRLAIQPAAAGRIADVQVKREYLARPDDEDVRKAEAAVQETADQIAALDDEVKVLDAQSKQVESIRAFSLEKLPKDTAVREIDMDAYGKVVGFVSGTLREGAKARREIEAKRRVLAPELAARQRKLAERKQMTQLEQSAILAAVEGGKEGEAGLVLSYLLPGATWEPVHELRAGEREPKSVRLVSCAVVTQTTGEDWNNATLCFSTQSPTETVRIPELDALLVGSSRAIGQLVGGHTESYQRAAQAFKDQQTGWIQYNYGGVDVQNLCVNNLRMIDTSTRTTAIFEKLQTRGTTAHFQGEGRPTVRTDGRSVRVPIGQVDLAAQCRLVAAPQVSLNVARTVEMTNTGKQPLLPGKVSLFSEGAFLGTTDREFVAEGETFSVYLGVADHIKLSRVMDRQNSSFVAGKKNRIQVAFDTTVENLSAADTSLSLADRIPVSENRDISVYRVRVNPAVEPDSKGLLKWTVTLKPKEKRVYRVEYTVEYPPEVLEKEARSKKAAGTAAPEADSAAESTILKLESWLR